MDFSQQYFANAQPYQFMGMPPLTPSQTNSAASDDYHTTSPPDVYPEYSNPEQHFSSFESYPPHFDSNPNPNQNPNPVQNGHQNQNAFPSPPPPPPPQQNQPLNSQGPHVANGSHPSQAPPLPPDQPPAQNHDVMDFEQQPRRAGSNSDDEDLTPAQSRRKAQNRAAQRAFRERKEKHVKDLEAKLANLEAEARQTSDENERLKREMQKMSTENEILRATGGANGHSPHSPEPRTTGPLKYSPTDFYSDLLAKHNNKTPSHRVVTSDNGERLLAAAATWDFIINHESFKRGLVDVARVSEHLKNKAQCDGQGPVFPERSILEAIESSVTSGNDELL